MKTPYYTKGDFIMTVERRMTEEKPNETYDYRLIDGYESFINMINGNPKFDVALSMFCNTFHKLTYDEYEYYMSLYIANVDVSERERLLNEFRKQRETI